MLPQGTTATTYDPKDPLTCCALFAPNLDSGQSQQFCPRQGTRRGLCACLSQRDRTWKQAKGGRCTPLLHEHKEDGVAGACECPALAATMTDPINDDSAKSVHRMHSAAGIHLASTSGDAICSACGNYEPAMNPDPKFTQVYEPATPYS